MRVHLYLEQCASRAIESALGESVEPMLRPAKDAAHGDFQINGVIALGKKLGRPPRELAQAVAGKLTGCEALESAQVAGPGFVNLKLSPSWVAQRLTEIAAEPERMGVPKVDNPARIVVDFSSPNVAKTMHVGHLRSTIIGAVLVRLLRFVGHYVIGDNHLGDWGTQFGLLIAGMRRFGSAEALEKAPISELERIYQLASTASKQEPEFAERARAELAKLQAGDPENRSLWERFLLTTRRELERTYQRMDISFDCWLGESTYQQMLPGIIEELTQRGIAREDQGAICVFFDDIPELASSKTPFLVRKKDGAFLYATTDIATAIYRRDRYQADRAVYVVDQRQSLHFKQLFVVVKKLGIALEMEHVGFGTVLGADNRPLKTREGNAIKLVDLLDEAERRAAERMRQEGLDLTEKEIVELAPVVGIGAIKYADLQQNRLSDYRFDWDKMISFKGNAGPYLQYAYARIMAIFRKGKLSLDDPSVRAPIHLGHKSELELGKHLLAFPEVIYQAVEGSFPHLLCDHLYSLARLFSNFYEECPILAAEPEQRASRLALANLVACQLKLGLGLLGIQVAQRM
jgi:arginyl-tRNA synthetase